MPGGQPAPTTAKGDKVMIYAPIDVAVDKFCGNGRVGETDSSVGWRERGNIYNNTHFQEGENFRPILESLKRGGVRNKMPP